MRAIGWVLAMAVFGAAGLRAEAPGEDPYGDLAGGRPGPAQLEDWARVTPLQAAFMALPPAVGGAVSRIRLLAGNQESWYARWWLASRATRSLDATYFMIYPDVYGKAFLGLLARKAREGVRIRLMLDDRGGYEMTRLPANRVYLEALATLPQVEVRVYNPIPQALLALPIDVRKTMASNHDKLLMADRRLLLTGGRNIGRPYHADPRDEARGWRDTDVMLESAELAAQGARAFDLEWNGLATHRVTGDPQARVDALQEIDVASRVMDAWMEGLPGLPAFPADPRVRWVRAANQELAKDPAMTRYPAFAAAPFEGAVEGPAKLLDKGGLGTGRDEIRASLVALIDAAQESIYIQNPYVVLGWPVRAALERASRRGVRILLHTNSPASTDSLLTQAYFLQDWKALLQELPTLRIFAFEGTTKLHSKVFVFDREVTCVGTYNLDPLSEVINSEETAAIYHPALAARARAMIDADLAASREYRIRVHPDGRVETLAGPEETLTRTGAWLVKVIQKVGFLRRLV